jgi:starvation-inducible DNA-binding protein
MQATLNDLKTSAKHKSITTLNALVAQSIDLALVTKQAHWNLRGPQFIAIHLMLDGFRAEIDEHTDIMAERIVQLGGTVAGTLQTVAEATALPPYPPKIRTISEQLPELIKRYGLLANGVRAAIAETDDAGDADTADILTGFSRVLDKDLWFLESHQD